MLLLVTLPLSAQEADMKGAEYCSKKKSAALSTRDFSPESQSSPRHSFDVLNYTLNLDLYNCFVSPYPRTFTAQSIVSFRVDTALSSIRLNAVNTSPTIDSVGLAGVSFTHASNILTVNLDRAYAPDEMADVKIFYRHNNVSDAAFFASGGFVFTDCEPEGARK